MGQLEEQRKQRVLELARQGNISDANKIIERLRDYGNGSSTTDLNLLCLKREVYRGYIQFCEDSAEEELDKKQPDAAERYIQIARKYSLELNSGDARRFWREGSKLYQRLDELRESSA